MDLCFGTTNIENTTDGNRNIDESRRFGVRIIINQLVIICLCIDVFSWIDYFNMIQLVIGYWVTVLISICMLNQSFLQIQTHPQIQ